MKKIFVLVFFFSSASIHAQIGQHFFGGSGYDIFHQIVPAPDGNFYVIGSKFTTTNLVWLMKVNSKGNSIWEKTYALSAPGTKEYGNGLTVLANGNLLITGVRRTDGTSFDDIALAILADSDGNQIWKHTYESVSALYDGVASGNNFLLVGPGLLIRVNGSGVLQSQIPINVSKHNYVKRIFPTTDGNFLLLGRANVVGAGFEGIFLIKIDSGNNIVWSVQYNTDFREETNFGTGSDFYNQPMGAVQMPDGSVWVTNPSGDYREITLLHFSKDGDFLEEKKYGSGNIDEYPYSLGLLPDGGFLITGRTESYSNSVKDEGGFAMRTTANGLEVWRKYYGNSNVTQRLFCGTPTTDGAFLLAGSSYGGQGIPGNADGWLLVAEENGNVLPWNVQGKVVYDINGNCLVDPNEPPAISWFINANDGQKNIPILTDADGNFYMNTDNSTNTFTLLPPGPDNEWSVCQNGLSITSNASNPQTIINFAVKAVDPDCPLTEVSLTQPDLVRCKNSSFIVTVKNRGQGNSENQTLKLTLNNFLNFVSVSEPAVQNGQEIQIDLQPMAGFSEKNIQVEVQLNCNAQLGDTHPILASISPITCSPVWSGPEFSVSGYCNGNEVVFDMQNIGGGGIGASTTYRVLADDLIAVDEVNINLPESGPPSSLSFPADGRTWRVELKQAPNFPTASNPVAFVQDCGKGSNGLYAITHQDAFRLDDAMPERSYISPPNTVGVPNKISAAVHGFGFYHLIDDKEPNEYTARVRNPLQTPATEVVFDLSFSPSYDLTSFEALASNGKIESIITEGNGIRATMKNVQIDTGASAMFRFRISPIDSFQPDLAQKSNLAVDGKAYFNDFGPVDMPGVWLNYSNIFPLKEDPYYDYPPEVLQFGGRYYTFGTVMAKADNSIFLGGETVSFNEWTNYNAYLVKTDLAGKVIWQEAYKLDGGFCTTKGIVPLSDGGCLLAGNSKLQNESDNYLSDYYPFIARIDKDGKMIWWKRNRPAGDVNGAWVSGMLSTKDGGAIVHGYSTNQINFGNDEYYWKIDENGETIWITYSNINGSAFEPYRGKLMQDGSFIFAGSNHSTVSDFEIYLQKISATGQKLWSKGYNTINGGTMDGLEVAEDGGFLTTGTSYGQTTPTGETAITPVFVKFDTNGNYQWEKYPIIGPFYYSWPRNMTKDPSGGYYISGEIYVDTTEHFSDIMLLKISEDAEVEWYKSFGSKNYEWADDIVVPNDSLIVMWGFNQQAPPLYNLQALLTVTDSKGGTPVSIKEVIQDLSNKTLVMPNPSKDRSNVILSPPPKNNLDWLVTDISGYIITQGQTNSGLFELDLGGLSAGLYFLIFPSNEYPPQKIVVTK